MIGNGALRSDRGAEQGGGPTCWDLAVEAGGVSWLGAECAQACHSGNDRYPLEQSCWGELVSVPSHITTVRGPVLVLSGAL